MTLFTMFMATDHKDQYESRTTYNDYGLDVYTPKQITIKPKQMIKVCTEIAIQMNDNRAADQSPFFVVPHTSMLNKKINFNRPPVYIHNKYNYLTLNLTLVNNSTTDVIIEKYEPIGTIINTSLFDLIIV